MTFIQGVLEILYFDCHYLSLWSLLSQLFQRTSSTTYIQQNVVSFLYLSLVPNKVCPPLHSQREYSHDYRESIENSFCSELAYFPHFWFSTDFRQKPLFLFENLLPNDSYILIMSPL